MLDATDTTDAADAGRDAADAGRDAADKPRLVLADAVADSANETDASEAADPVRVVEVDRAEDWREDGAPAWIRHRNTGRQRRWQRCQNGIHTNCGNAPR